MITAVLRGLAAASLALLPLTVPAPAHAVETLPLTEAVTRLPVEAESRDGYDRDAFRHWERGDDPDDGCNTRGQVRLAQAGARPTVGARCRRSGVPVWSHADRMWATSASGLRLDRVVPLPESSDSGAAGWPAQRREAYANDQGADASLVAITARSNRSKSHQDPAERLPP